MEKNPWWTRIEGPFDTWSGPVGVKEDGGGSIRGRGRVGAMRVHRAVCNHDVEAIREAVAQGADVNEVEGAGNTPLHNAAYEGWAEGVELLLNLGAKINASNNAGDRSWHWAQNMKNKQVMKLLEAARPESTFPPKTEFLVEWRGEGAWTGFGARACAESESAWSRCSVQCRRKLFGVGFLRTRVLAAPPKAVCRFHGMEGEGRQET